MRDIQSVYGAEAVHVEKIVRAPVDQPDPEILRWLWQRHDQGIALEILDD